jgi:hypothetical protein
MDKSTAFVHEFPVRAKFFSCEQLRQRWTKGQLAAEYANSYPQLFDDQDLQIAKKQPEQHFHEWLCAVLLYHTGGWLSLVEQYGYKSHLRKRQVLESLVAEKKVRDCLYERGKGACVQNPDLFVYKPDLSEWFLCEVKGPRDQLHDTQVAAFLDIREHIDREIYLIEVITTVR